MVDAESERSGGEMSAEMSWLDDAYDEILPALRADLRQEYLDFTADQVEMVAEAVAASRIFHANRCDSFGVGGWDA